MSKVITRPLRAKGRGQLLKAAVVIPDLIMASLLWLMILALLPPTVAFMVAVLGIIVMALVAAGLGEGALVRSSIGLAAPPPTKRRA